MYLMVFQRKIHLPYMVDFKLLDKLFLAVGQRGSLSVSELYAQLSDVDDSAKSAAKNMGEYLGLVRTENRVVYLTELGSRAIRSDDLGRRNVLIQNLPVDYIDILKLLHENKGSLSVEQLTSLFLDDKELNPKAFVGKYIVRTWANYMERLGLVVYTKGRNSGVQLSKLAEQLLQNAKTVSPPAENQQLFVVRIVTPGRVFQHDIQNDLDWTVVEAALNSAREAWKNYHAH